MDGERAINLVESKQMTSAASSCWRDLYGAVQLLLLLLLPLLMTMSLPFSEWKSISGADPSCFSVARLHSYTSSSSWCHRRLDVSRGWVGASSRSDRRPRERRVYTLQRVWLTDIEKYTRAGQLIASMEHARSSCQRTVMALTLPPSRSEPVSVYVHDA